MPDDQEDKEQEESYFGYPSDEVLKQDDSKNDMNDKDDKNDTKDNNDQKDKNDKNDKKAECDPTKTLKPRVNGIEAWLL